MRTTVDLPDGLLEKARMLAHEEHVTLSEIVERALRDRLLRAKSEKPAGAFKLVTFGQGGLVPGLTWNRVKDVLNDDDLARAGVSRANDGKR